MTLTSRILLFALTLVLVIGTLSHIENWRIGRDQQRQLQANVADLKQLLRQFAVMPAILATDPRLSDALVSQNTQNHSDAVALANNVLRLATDRSDAAFAFLMDKSGLTIAASNYQQPVSFVGRNYGFRPYFSKALVGTKASYFAVGATTGIPGYFVSEPVRKDGEVIGVIAVKLEPQKLPMSWNTESAVALVTDDLGVSILSTDDQLLYIRTKKLDEPALRLIEEERRYSITNSNYLDIQNQNRWQLLSEQGKPFAAYRVSSVDVGVEPWSLSLLTPMRMLHVNVLRNLFFLIGILMIAGLLLHAYRQQVRLAQERAKLANRLEQLVDEKTRELEGAQQALIAESNYSMLGKMSAAINHEINQPLASLRLNLATLRQLIENAGSKGSSTEQAILASASTGSAPGEDTIQSTVVDLDRTAKRITRVIDTLRALPQQNRSGFLPVDVHQLLHDSVDNLRADRKQLSQCLQLALTIEPGESHVLGQRILLQQALLNVLYNALDAVAAIEKPYAELRVSVLDGNVLINVKDNGAGVSPDMESALFEPFESAPEKVSGMGIGLTLARQIINDHGGTLAYHRASMAQSYAPDGLTVFTITIPTMNTGLRGGLTS